MAYNEHIVDRIREALVNVPDVEERALFSGITFMVNDKMCIGVKDDDIMCRIHPELMEEVLERNGTRQMRIGGKASDSFLFVSEDGFQSKKDFDFWVRLCLDFNPLAKASPRKKKK